MSDTGSRVPPADPAALAPRASPGLTERQWAVVELMARRYHEDGVWWHKARYLARDLGYTRNEVKYDLIQLRAHGLVTTWRPGRQTGGMTWGLVGVVPDE